MTGKQSWFEHWEPLALPIQPQPRLHITVQLASLLTELASSLREAAVLLPLGVRPAYCSELIKALDSTTKAITAYAIIISMPPEQFRQ